MAVRESIFSSAQIRSLLSNVMQLSDAAEKLAGFLREQAGTDSVLYRKGIAVAQDMAELEREIALELTLNDGPQVIGSIVPDLEESVSDLESS